MSFIKFIPREISLRCGKIFLEQMRMVLDFDGAEFYLTDLKDSHRFCNGVKYNCEIDGKYVLRNVEKKFTDFFGKKCIVSVKLILIPSEIRLKSSYYKEYYVLNNWQYSMHLLLGDGNDCVGLVTLYRTIGKG